MYTYLLIDLLSLSVPLIFTFHPKLRFHHTWGAFAPALLLTALLFLAWDVLFTHWGVWGFNPAYLSGPAVAGLPLEEILFFVCIPYASVFTYHSLKIFFPHPLQKASKYITGTLILLLLILAFTHTDRAYTISTFLLTAIFLLGLTLWVKPTWMGNFYLAFAVILLPFFITNGILTGSFIPDEVVWYNNAENLGIRLGTIPVEDSMYGLLLILMNVTGYEYLLKRKNRNQNEKP